MDGQFGWTRTRMDNSDGEGRKIRDRNIFVRCTADIITADTTTADIITSDANTADTNTADTITADTNTADYNHHRI